MYWISGHELSSCPRQWLMWQRLDELANAIHDALHVGKEIIDTVYCGPRLPLLHAVCALKRWFEGSSIVSWHDRSGVVRTLRHSHNDCTQSVNLHNERNAFHTTDCDGAVASTVYFYWRRFLEIDVQHPYLRFRHDHCMVQTVASPSGHNLRKLNLYRCIEVLWPTGMKAGVVVLRLMLPLLLYPTQRAPRFPNASHALRRATR